MNFDNTKIIKRLIKKHLNYEVSEFFGQALLKKIWLSKIYGIHEFLSKRIGDPNDDLALKINF